MRVRACARACVCVNVHMCVDSNSAIFLDIHCLFGLTLRSLKQNQLVILAPKVFHSLTSLQQL